MQSFKTLARRVVLTMGRYLIVESHTVQAPDGRILPDWPWIITPDYINVLVETTAGKFLVFNQIKYGLPDGTLALIGGYIEPGEVPAGRSPARSTGGDWIPGGRMGRPGQLPG